MARLIYRKVLGCEIYVVASFVDAERIVFSHLTALLSCQEFIDFWVVTWSLRHGVKYMAGVVVPPVYVPVILSIMIGQPISILKAVGFDDQPKVESRRLQPRAYHGKIAEEAIDTLGDEVGIHLWVRAKPMIKAGPWAIVLPIDVSTMRCMSTCQAMIRNRRLERTTTA